MTYAGPQQGQLLRAGPGPGRRMGHSIGQATEARLWGRRRRYSGGRYNSPPLLLLRLLLLQLLPGCGRQVGAQQRGRVVGCSLQGIGRRVKHSGCKRRQQ